MSKEIQKILLFFLISYSIYCAIIIGETWDEGFHLNQGKIVLDYIFSFGEIDNHFLHREQFSTIYWSLSYLLTKQFPLQYQIEVSHLLNLIFSLSAIIGIGKLTQELFNKKVGKIVFLILLPTVRAVVINTPEEILKKGESKLIINTSQERIENIILSNPEDLANKLKEFGLKEGIKSIEIKQETLEEIMLSEINKNVS